MSIGLQEETYAVFLISAIVSCCLVGAIGLCSTTQQGLQHRAKGLDRARAREKEREIQDTVGESINVLS